jgi:putative ATP-dependent endonuclease of OLD family
VKKETEIKAYGDDKIYELITGAKTQFAPVIAEQIVKSDKALPPKILELFGKINSMLNITEEVS